MTSKKINQHLSGINVVIDRAKIALDQSTVTLTADFGPSVAAAMNGIKNCCRGALLKIRLFNS